MFWFIRTFSLCCILSLTVKLVSHLPSRRENLFSHLSAISKRLMTVKTCMMTPLFYWFTLNNVLSPCVFLAMLTNSMASGMAMLICWSFNMANHFGPDCNISTTIGWIAMKFATDIQSPETKNSNDFGGPLTLTCTGWIGTGIPRWTCILSYD